MCNFAKKINIYFRDNITNSDVVLTYLFIISMLVVLIFYTKQYYTIVDNDLDKCEENKSDDACMKTEISYILVPYIGIIYSFFQVLYKMSEIIAFIINCMCY